jgi:hypothetical protein
MIIAPQKKAILTVIKKAVCHYSQIPKNVYVLSKCYNLLFVARDSLTQSDHFKGVYFTTK